MFNPWNNQTSEGQRDFQGNQLLYSNSNQSSNTRAYLNPQIVNCEFIKRKLSNNNLQGGTKIHVNPNFRGNVLGHLTNCNHPHLKNPINHVETSRTFSTPSALENKNNINSYSNGMESNFNCTTSVSLNRFKKVNKVNPKNNAMYSWSQGSNNTSTVTSVSYNKNCPVNKIESVLEKAKSLNYNCLASKYKYTSSEKSLLIPNDSCQTKRSNLIYKSKTKIINKSKTNVLINTCTKNKIGSKEISSSPNRRQLNLTKFTYVRNKQSSVSRVAKAVRNKYIYLCNLENSKKSKYKIDKRHELHQPVKKSKYKIDKRKITETKKSSTSKGKDIRKLFPNYFYNKVKLSAYNIYNLNSGMSASSNIYLWRKNQPFSKATQKVINNKFPNRRVVKIGGILYKSTTNKLTLASRKLGSNSKKTVTSLLKAKRDYVVYVRGEKFILERNGKALRRQSANVNSEKTPLLTPKRIDLGGVTYIQKSQNVLIRTNVHQARYLVNKAKNKSIALLTNLHKRSSMPCMIYHKFGRCIRHTKGLCMYKHDPKNIAVCKKFLKGDCTNKNCLLSHEAVQEKMATCHFFLSGLCVRENCPFLHVKLNKNAAICENFVQGFCNLGKDCSKRHLHQCPKFDKNSICSLGSKCPYPHRNLKKLENLPGSSEKSKDGSETVQYYVKSDIQPKQKKRKRYMTKTKESAKVQRKATKKEPLSFDNPNHSNTAIECFPKRIKLDKLPCFIPLNSNS